MIRPSIVLLAAVVVGVLGLTAAGANVGGADNFLAATVTPAPERPMLFEQAAAGSDLSPQAIRPESSVPLASGVLREAVERTSRGQAAGEAVDVVGNSIRVEVLHYLSSPEMRAVIESLGGVVEGEIEGLTQALVPVESLVTLESNADVRYLRPPLEANIPILPQSEQQGGAAGAPAVGEEVAKTNADAWHSVGILGNGVKVGMIDYFDGGLWNNAVAAGELPTPAGTFCRILGASCDIWIPGETDGAHGEGVAEIIHEMAPNAELYLARVRTTTDLQSAVDFFVGNGVQIISRSLGSAYDGPGDGTGPIADVIDNAVANGITWFNSAGNSAGGGIYPGSYWRGQWIDEDGDGWLEFAPGDELLSYSCQFAHGLRWSDFGTANPTDYDVSVYDSPGDLFPIKSSTDDQTAGALPIEFNIPCRSESNVPETDYLAVKLFEPGSGTSGDILEFMTNGAVQHSQNPYSA